MLQPTFIPRSSHNNATTKTTVRAVVFVIDNYLFALSIYAVTKIVTCPNIDTPIKNCIGLIEWQGRGITVIDLKQRLSGEQTTTSRNRFLILTQTKGGETCGFISEQSPAIVNLSLDDIYPVPASYREASELGFVSHMALLANDEAETALKVFLLGSDWEAT